MGTTSRKRKPRIGWPARLRVAVDTKSKPNNQETQMKYKLLSHSLTVLAVSGALMCAIATGQAADKPNVLFIMGDDIGMWNIGAYHRGMMAGRTPNLDKMAKEGMLFTDY